MAAFAQFGSDLDAATQKMLARGARLTELLKQPQYQPMPMAEEVVVIYGGVNGYLDTLKVSDVGRFEQGLLGELRANGQDILNAIQTTGQLDGDTEQKLKTLLDKFLERFS
jgi:F-type H+-transporting ATPase subunit alpha